MTARALIAAGAALAAAASFLTYVDFSTGAAVVDGEVLLGERLTFWELAQATDVALLVLCVAAGGFAAAGLRAPAAVAAVAVAAIGLLTLVEMRGNEVPASTGMWLMGAGGAVAAAGALVVAAGPRASPPRLAAAALVGGVLAAVAAMFAPQAERGRETVNYWESSYGSDVALLVLALVTVGLVVARLGAPAALAGAALGSNLVLGLVESLASETLDEPSGVWLTAASGAVALAGAALVLLQRSTRAS